MTFAVVCVGLTAPFAIASSVLLPGCGGKEAPIKTQTAEIASAPRRPDGIVIDLPHALPQAADRADARGVVALREPLSKDAMVAVVRAYADGFLKEDIDALRSLLASDAMWLAPQGTPSVSTNIVEVWQTRLRNFDYARLAGAEIFRADKIEVLTFDETKDVRPPLMRPDDIYVVVPIQTPRVGTDAFFPERVSFLLRRDKARYVIIGLGEDFTP
jgi:hypothetical protein